MALMISRSGHLRGRPVRLEGGISGATTSHSASVTSVWYRRSSRLCCLRVAGVHIKVSPIRHRQPVGSTTAPPAQPFRDGLLAVRSPSAFDYLAGERNDVLLVIVSFVGR